MNKLFTLLVALPLFVSAQNKGDVEIGIGGGLSLATFYGGDSDSYDFIGSSMGGVTGEYYVDDQWSIKSGFIYDSKGGKIESSDTEIVLDYLFIPLYANWHFGNNRDWYLNFGPYLNVLLDAQKEGVDFNDAVEPIDVGFGVGIGHKFEISDNASIFVEYQGAGGFLEVPGEDEGDFAENGIRDLFNLRSGINAGIIFIP